jgi:hypothetical protein
MVNTAYLRLLPYELPPPIVAGTRIKLPGPRYDLGLVKQAASPAGMRLLTKNCSEDVLRLGWTVDEVYELLQAATAGDYKDSEWCETSARMHVDCDAYALHFNTIALTRDPRGKNMYLKFGYRPANVLLLIISCHD